MNHQELAAAIIAASPDAIWSCTLEGVITSWNAGAASLLGYDEAEVLGKQAGIVFPDGAEDALTEQLQRVARGEPFEAVEDVYQTKHGRLVQIGVRVSPIRQDGRVVGAAWLARPIVAVSALDQRLARAAGEIRDLYDRAPCGYHSLDPEGVILQINQTELDWLGYSRAEVVGRLLFADLLTPDSREAFNRSFEHFKRRGQAKDVEYELRAKDGRLLTVLYNATVIRDAEGNYVACRATLFDITRRKRAEDLARIYEQRFVRAFEDAPSGMALVGLDGHWLLVNPALATMLGAAQDELLGARVLDFIAESDHGKAVAMPGVLSRSGQLRSEQELRFVTRDGRQVWVLVTFSLVRDAEDRPLYYTAQYQDVTARREIERAKDEFTAMVAHELRTPMTAICGSLGLLDAGLLGEISEEAREMVGIAIQSTNRLVRLINDFLDFERMRAGQILIDAHRVDASELIREAADMLRPLGAEVNVALAVDAPHLTVSADPDRLIQVLTNLLSNAIKFSSPGGTVSIGVHPEPDESVVFEVRDHGRGIPKDELDHIFERFRQVRPEDSTRKGGTGLGLAIAKAIVEQHGGRIWAESTPGEGTVIRFRIPRGRQPSVTNI